MKLITGDFKKLCDDFKRISQAIQILKDAKKKDSKLFDITLDLVARELDRLFLDITEIHNERDSHECR